jgi:cobalamin-dependent methionine synthase I
VNDVDLDIGKTIAVQLRKAESLAAFVCTIGPGLEKWSKQLMDEGDFFKGYMVDAIASQTVELAIDTVQHHLENELEAQDLKLTNRYNPGYCGWHVSEQHKLFSLLPKNFCDIQLTDSSLMLPIKSVSGIIGIGTDVRKMDYTCRLCEMTDCIYRRRLEKIPQDA